MRMERSKYTIFTVGLVASAVVSFVDANLLLHNAVVYTVDPTNEWAECVAIDENGLIEDVGTDAEVMPKYPLYEKIDLDGQLVLPGFHDVHLHAVEAGINAQICEIPESTSAEDIPFVLADCPDGGLFGDQGWIMGAGIDLAFLIYDMLYDYPLDILDEAYPNTPVLILDNLGHGALANTAALREVGYLDLTNDPPGGRVLQDADGYKLGIVLENAQQKLRDAAFPPTDANKEIAYESLMDALYQLAQNGITSISDAGGFWRQAQTEAWARAANNGDLSVRASNALYVYPDEPMEDQLPKLIERYSNNKNSLIRFNQAKIYVDGILSLGTAKLTEPYSSDLFANYSVTDQNLLGMEYFGTSENLNSVSQDLVNAGFQLHYHVVGNQATKLALDAIKFATDNGSISSEVGPHRLTHCYLVDEEDFSTFTENGVVADFQLASSSLDELYIEEMKFDLGPARASRLLPAPELYRAGATITISSDWDADDLSPLLKLQTLLEGLGEDNFDSLKTVIPLLTLNGAKLLHQDDQTGSIEIGKFADLTVIDRNIFEVPVSEIAYASVTLTMLEGVITYDSESDGGFRSIEDETIKSGGESSLKVRLWVLQRIISLSILEIGFYALSILF